MRKFLIISAALGGLAVTPALADVSVNISPEIDTWAQSYDAPAVTYEGDIAVGTEVPDTVKLVEVPGHTEYRFVNLNKKRVLVDAKTRKVVKVYQ